MTAPSVDRDGPRDDPAPAAARLIVLARSAWPAQPPAPLPALPGFIVSSFNPLAAHLAERCLLQYFGRAPADPARGRLTAVVLASSTGDIATAVAVARAVDQRRPVSPLLFYQSNPNAVAGHIAARWGLEGPVTCTIPARRGLADAVHSATALIEDGEAAAALVILAGQGRPGGDGAVPADDSGTALLIGPACWQPAAPPAPPGTRAGAAGTTFTFTE
jgi:hypothetical protein